MQQGRTKKIFHKIAGFILTWLIFLFLQTGKAEAAENNSTLDNLLLFKTEKENTYQFNLFQQPLFQNNQNYASNDAREPQPTPTVKISQVKREKLADDKLFELFEKYAKQYNVDCNLLIKIARCESGFNQAAVNGPYGGMFQFLASTWVSNRALMGLDPNPDLRFEAEESIKTAGFKISRDGSGAWPVCSRK